METKEISIDKTKFFKDLDDGKIKYGYDKTICTEMKLLMLQRRKYHDYVAETTDGWNTCMAYKKAATPCVCVDGYGLTRLNNGELRLVKDLIKGDVIVNSNGDIATIICVIKTLVKDGHTNMLSINNMKVTPWHPIRIRHDSKWSFPCNLGTPELVQCDYVYNFVLDQHHIITINDIDVITLGHGVEDDPVLKHPFFGTQKIIDYLRGYSGFSEGLIEIKEVNPIYDNGLIIGFL